MNPELFPLAEEFAAWWGKRPHNQFLYEGNAGLQARMLALADDDRELIFNHAILVTSLANHFAGGANG